MLRIAGFDAVFHPYDWRRDIAGNGRALADRLLRERRQDVVLVGHSMGGLVARAALAHKGGERIARVIQLGTPNRGAFVAIQALRGTYPLIRRVAMLDLLHDADELAREVLTTFPGLCELLPAASRCKDFDPFDAEQWPERPESGRATARGCAPARSRPCRRRMSASALIAGFGQDTVLGVKRRGQRLEFGRGPAGDGTVPLALAHWPGLPTWYVEESHGSLPGNAEVGRAVIDLARGDTTEALPHVLPRRRGVPTLWEDDTRAPPPVEDRLERSLRAPAARIPARIRRDRATLPTAIAPVARRGAQARPVELAFVEGSITQSDASALVLGAFANVEPAGAALAVDTMLHGAISDLARRRAIGAAAGEVFVLPVGRRGLAARLVVLAGLGDFGRYGPDVQRLAAANVTRTLALAGVGDFAMVLWGTASGADAGRRRARAARGRADRACRSRAGTAPAAHHDHVAQRPPPRRGAPGRGRPAAPASGGAAPAPAARDARRARRPGAR